jgi:signal transduction histidine kinase
MAKAKILIVEDELIVAKNLEQKLTRADYTVVGLAVSGIEAIDYAQNAAPDLVLMDIKLEGQLDGIQTAAELKKIINVPVIYLTAFADESTLSLAKVNEPYGYIIKPFEMRELISNIEIALYKSKIEKKLRDSHEALQTLFQNEERIREKERKHISREIHDELGQSLTALKMDLFWLDKQFNNAAPEIMSKLKDMTAILNHTIGKVKNIAAGLRPEILDELGFEATIEWLVDDFKKHTQIPMDIIMEVEDLTFTSEQTYTIYRLIQETLTNIARHSNAERASITFSRTSENHIISIKDNGSGFNIEGIDTNASLGLRGMRERSNLCNGTMEIFSETGSGTTITFTLPYEERT